MEYLQTLCFAGVNSKRRDFQQERREKQQLQPRIKISVNTDISVIGFYGNIGNIGKISVDIFTKISVIKFFHILII